MKSFHVSGSGMSTLHGVNTLLLLRSDGIGRWEEVCTESCPQGRTELPIFSDCMVFKEPTRTQKNLLSLSYSSNQSCVRLKPWTMPDHFCCGLLQCLTDKKTFSCYVHGTKWVDLESAFASGRGRQPTRTRKVSWTSDGSRRIFW